MANNTQKTNQRFLSHEETDFRTGDQDAISPISTLLPFVHIIKINILLTWLFNLLFTTVLHPQTMIIPPPWHTGDEFSLVIFPMLNCFGLEKASCLMLTWPFRQMSLCQSGLEKLLEVGWDSTFYKLPVSKTGDFRKSNGIYVVSKAAKLVYDNFNHCWVCGRYIKLL